MSVGGEAWCADGSSSTWTCETTMDSFNGQKSSESKSSSKYSSGSKGPYKLLAIADDYSSYAIKYSCSNDDGMMSAMMGPMKKEYITISSKN